MLSRTTMIVGLALAASLSLGLFWEAGSSRSEPASQDSEADGDARDSGQDELREDVSELRSALRRMSRAIASLSERKNSDEGAQVAEDEPLPEEPEDLAPPPLPKLIEEDIARKVAQRTELLRTLLEDEQVDSAWSQEMEAQAEGLVETGALESSELLSIECASTLCELHFKHANRDEFNDMPETIKAIEHKIAYVRGEPYGEGEDMYTTVFLSRVGHELPR